MKCVMWLRQLAWRNCQISYLFDHCCQAGIGGQLINRKLIASLVLLVHYGEKKNLTKEKAHNNKSRYGDLPKDFMAVKTGLGINADRANKTCTPWADQ